MLGQFNLFFVVFVGNMDFMINCYIVDLKICYDDVYIFNNEGGKCFDWVVLIYIQCCCEVYKDILVLVGGIEVSLCRIVYYDYWFNKVCRSVLMDFKVDLLVYGNVEWVVVEVVYWVVVGQEMKEICDVCGMVCMLLELLVDWEVKDFIWIDIFGCVDVYKNFYYWEENNVVMEVFCVIQGGVKEDVLVIMGVQVVYICFVVGSK